MVFASLTYYLDSRGHTMKHQFFRRRKMLIKPRYQLRLAFSTVFFLFVYSVVFGTTIFYPLATELYSSASLEDRARVAFVVLGLHERIWPALLIISVLVFIGMILLSQRVAGPVYRLERAIEEFLNGNFTERMRLRKHDVFKEIETMTNRLAEYLEKAKSLDSRLHADLRENLSILSTMLKTKDLSGSEEARKIVDGLIEKLDSQPDAFSASWDKKLMPNNVHGHEQYL